MYKKIKLVSSIGLVCASLIFTGCSSEDNGTNELDELNSQLEEFSVKLENLGFNTDDLVVIDFQGTPGFLVERDIFLTPEKINNMSPAVSVDNGELNVEHYRTTNLVEGTPRTIYVYMDSGFNSDMQAAFDLAISRYNSENLNLTFARASSAGADIDILAQRIPKYYGWTILGQSAGFPENGEPASPIILNSSVYSPKRGNIPADAATVIAHEIGHAIGFRHTDYMDRSFSCGGSADNEGDAGVGAVHISGTPTTPDGGSWMLACSNGTDRPFTANDKTALANTY
ncbi:M57 family metalloprotease [Aegicerativicinus sediminis]|uniref:M57 family metalloprotease n=1 Tax=Aegicerativicinus sediminis TaxID=2893202 RepID=UPI001E40CC41|nr:M57 family metalloprotease [Aegicerativicinus sediminis]